MNQEITAELVLQCQAGDVDAMEQLLFLAYTPVSYLCSKILQEENAALEQTREILQIIAGKLNTLKEPELFEKWMCRITAARCTQQLPQLRWGSDQTVPVRRKHLDIAGKDLDEAQTADAVQQMVDNLPEDPRLCILLYCCSGMNSGAIGQLAGYSVDAVHDNLAKGQALIQQQLEEYMEQGTTFSGITSLAALMHTAMYQPREDENALPMIYGILGKEMPVPPDPGKWVVRLLGTIAAILFIVFLGLCGIFATKLLGIL